MITLAAVSAVIWVSLACYWAAETRNRLRNWREGRTARERQVAAVIADATPDEIAELLIPAGTGAVS